MLAIAIDMYGRLYFSRTLFLGRCGVRLGGMSKRRMEGRMPPFIISISLVTKINHFRKLHFTSFSSPRHHLLSYYCPIVSEDIHLHYICTILYIYMHCTVHIYTTVLYIYMHCTYIELQYG